MSVPLNSSLGGSAFSLLFLVTDNQTPCLLPQPADRAALREKSNVDPSKRPAGAAPAPPQARSSGGAPPKPPTPPAVPVPPKVPPTASQPAPRARRSTAQRPSASEAFARAAAPPPDEPAGTSLAEGEFDEDESRASFLAALQEWCGGHSPLSRAARAHRCCVSLCAPGMGIRKALFLDRRIR